MLSSKPSSNGGRSNANESTGKQRLGSAEAKLNALMKVIAQMARDVADMEIAKSGGAMGNSIKNCDLESATASRSNSTWWRWCFQRHKSCWCCPWLHLTLLSPCPLHLQPFESIFASSRSVALPPILGVVHSYSHSSCFCRHC